MKRVDYLGRYLYKWIILIFLVFALISVVFNAASYWRERQAYSEIIEQEQQNRIDYLSKTINNELIKLKVTARMVLKESSVQELYCKYDFMNSYEKDKLLEDIVNRCLEIDNLNFFVSASSFYLPEKGIRADRNGIEFTEDVYGFTNTYQTQELIIQQEGKAYIVEMSRKNYLKGWDADNILGIFVIELDTEMIQKELQLARVTEGDILFITGDESKRVLCQTGEAALEFMDEGGDGKIMLAGDAYELIEAADTGNFFRLYYLQDQTFLSHMAQKAVINILVFVGIIILVILGAIALFYVRVYHPLEILLVDAFEQIKKSNLAYRIPLPEKENVFANLYRNFNYMAERIDTLVSRELKQTILVNQADFKHLQAQINPHFMYNSYFLLYRMIKDGDREGSLLVCENLGKFFKYITRDSQESKSLAEEIEHARSYTVIQQFRHCNIIHVDFPELPEKFGYIEVPRLIIQPLMENVFKYVVNDLEDEGEVLIKVSYKETSEHLLICVENSGDIKDEQLEVIREILTRQDEKEEITALVNISTRLDLFFNQRKSMTLCRSELGGLMVCLHLKM